MDEFDVRRRGGFEAACRLLVLGALIHGAWAGGAAAEDKMIGSANAAVPPAAAQRPDWEAGLNFETSAHRAWYDVFWTGECDKLPFFERLTCVKRPSWSEVTQMVLAKSAPGQRETLRSRMIRLGRQIGHEWARHNEDRRIRTDDLQTWGDWLKESANVTGTIDRLDAAVQKRLGKN